MKHCTDVRWDRFHIGAQPASTLDVLVLTFFGRSYNVLGGFLHTQSRVHSPTAGRPRSTTRAVHASTKSFKVLLTRGNISQTPKIIIIVVRCRTSYAHDKISEASREMAVQSLAEQKRNCMQLWHQESREVFTKLLAYTKKGKPSHAHLVSAIFIQLVHCVYAPIESGPKAALEISHEPRLP